MELDIPSFFSSFAITVIVDNGVPNECAAAAAWCPIDSSSCSLAKTSSNLFNAYQDIVDWNILTWSGSKIL